MQEEYFDTNYLEDDLEKIKDLLEQKKFTA